MIWFWLLAAMVLSFGYVIIFGAPYLPTRRTDIEAMIADLPKKSGTFYDLGSGDGKVLLAAARRGYTVVGYELNPCLWLISQWRLRYYHRHIYLRSFWRANLQDADVVFVFLIDHFMSRLQTKAQHELKAGSWLVSYTFTLPHRKPTKQLRGINYYKF